MVWIFIALLSTLPLVLPSVLPLLVGEGSWGVPGASRFGLVLLPWLAFAGLPLAGEARRGELRRGGAAWLFPLALALPPLALAAGMDHAGGLLRPSWEEGGAVLVGGPLLVFLWRLSQRMTAGRTGAARVQALLWLLFVPLAAALRTALHWAPAPLVDGAHASEPVFVANLLGALDPLVWCSDWCGAQRDLAAASAALPLLLGVTLLAVGGVKLKAVRDPRRAPLDT